MDHVWEDPERYRSEVQSALARILADDEFLKSVQPAQFLKFVVEETLEGRGDRLKGYTIAVSALGQRSDFDPQSNSLVRVQACRLRKMLEQYYRGPDSQDSVRIVLSSGSYKPRFEGRSGGPTSAASEEGEQTSSRRRFGWPCARRFATIFLTVSVAIASAALVVRARQPAGATEVGWSYPSTPVVVVERANPVDPTIDTMAATTLAVDAIQAGLSVFDHFVVKWQADSDGRGKPDYLLSVSAAPSNRGAADFTFKLVYVPTTEIVWSQTFPQISGGDAASFDRMSNVVVSTVGDTDLGAIMVDQHRRTAMANAPLRGYACLLAAYDYIVIQSLKERGPARECLEREVSVNSPDAQALTLLSAILLYDYIDLLPDNKGTVDLERAESLAQRAFELSPYRSETSTTLFKSRLYVGESGDALAIAPKLLRSLPNSRRLIANVGIAYISRGRYDEGVAILSRLDESSLGAPIVAVPLLALAAYMRRDEATAGQFASRAVAARLPMGLVMRIVVCKRQGNQACVIEASQQLRRDFPGFAGDLGEAFFRHAFADEIRTALVSDLQAAGFFSEASK